MDEFIRFRNLLDEAGIPWEDATTARVTGTVIYRTHSAGYAQDDSPMRWSCIWGFGSYGEREGLLEILVGSYKSEPIGYLTADDAFAIVKALYERG